MEAERSPGMPASAARRVNAAEMPRAASFARAKASHEQGRFDDAASQYEAILADWPDDAGTLHLYGVVQFQRGHAAEAEALIRRAIAIEPDPLALANLGSILTNVGRMEEALTEFEAALRIDSRHVHALVRLGNTLVGLRRYEQALGAYDRALKVSPMLLDALCNRGAALRALGRHKEALESYERALTVDPRSFESYCNVGNVLRDLHRYPEALRNYERALTIMPDSPEILSVRGRTLVDLGRPKEALASFNEAIAARPDFVEAVYNSAVALERLGRAEEAIQRCARVLAMEPDHARALATSGNAQLHLKRYEEAVSAYQRALEIEPNAADVLCNQGSALRHLTRYLDALQSYDAAIAVDASLPEAWCNRGNVLQDMHCHEDALIAFDRAIALSPKYAMAWFNRGNALFEMFRFDDALQAYDQATAIEPDYAEVQFAKGFLSLGQGDFERGWEQYEWRLRDPASAHTRRVLPQPLWLGEEPLDGQTILIHAEQGFGDTLQFCRYAQGLSEKGAHVVLEVQSALKTLMASLAGPAQVLAAGESLPAFDFHCPLPSLPLAFRTELQSIPNETPYLHPDVQRVERWEKALGAKTRLRIGLAWSGNSAHRNDHNRSIELATLAPLFKLDAEWISLQTVVRERDVDVLDKSPLRRLDTDIHDFADTAAIIESLDLVIAVDTAVAHLAGALDRHVWILLPYSAEWRWLNEREDSPWYPSARLFRQSTRGDWGSVVDAVRTAIGTWQTQAPGVKS